eukprot:CAMPEP_0184691646 /NCGR_PEP_ID=MMETSP0313-20130426/431_1 /TAXON_ID=2792 /ORGANISM="Porphyridium aerugineum, Strain SAG 1380-2" /LENGTH=891 /DNA_ID=CAMNT_0027149399 /DNA_START=646 /DNA_END=3321 /DNA_ORIENTATION=-
MVDYSKWDKLAVSSSEDEMVEDSILDDYTNAACLCDECNPNSPASTNKGPNPNNYGNRNSSPSQTAHKGAANANNKSTANTAAKNAKDNPNTSSARNNTDTAANKHKPAGGGGGGGVTKPLASSTDTSSKTSSVPSKPGASRQDPQAQMSVPEKDITNLQQQMEAFTMAGKTAAIPVPESAAAASAVQTGGNFSSPALPSASGTSANTSSITRLTLEEYQAGKLAPPGAPNASAAASQAAAAGAANKKVANRRLSKTALGLNDIKKRTLAQQKRRSEEMATLHTSGNNAAQVSEIFSKKLSGPAAAGTEPVSLTMNSGNMTNTTTTSNSGVVMSSASVPGASVPGTAATPTTASKQVVDSRSANFQFVDGNLIASPTGLTVGVSAVKKQPPQYVKLAEHDDGEGLASIFYTHPKDHVPVVDPVDNRMHGWGITLPRDYHSEFARRMRQLCTYGLYKPCTLHPMPETQFVRDLMQKKITEIVNDRASNASSTLVQSDYIIRVSMCDVVPELYRVIKVSGGISLSALQDKVLSPVFGWSRNVHSYVFISQQDGSVYGPDNASYEDIIQLDAFGWESIDDSRVRLCDVLQKEGQIMHYVYDLEESWWHRMTVQQIRAPQESNGEVLVLEGAMACPPEEAMGMGMVGAKGSLGFCSALASGAIDCVEAGQAWNVNKPLFDPYEFSLEEVDARLSEALASPASARFGSKRIFYVENDGVKNSSNMLNSAVVGHLSSSICFIHGSNALNLTSLPDIHYPEPEAPEILETPLTGKYSEYVLRTSPLWKCACCNKYRLHGGNHPSIPMVSEVVCKSKDPKLVALCSWCGNPNQLSICSGCKRMRFCSKGCHEEAWKAGHRYTCGVEDPAKVVRNPFSEALAQVSAESQPQPSGGAAEGK